MKNDEVHVNLSSMYETSPEHYITGIPALSIPDEEDRDRVYDWHLTSHFSGGNPFSIVGKNFANSVFYLGTKGVRDASKYLHETVLKGPVRPIFVARPSRAIVDMLFNGVTDELDTKRIDPNALDLSSKARKEIDEFRAILAKNMIFI